MQVFGSGWTWLVADHHGVLRDEAQEDGEGEGEETGDNDVTSAEKKTPPLLRVMNTTNSSNPMLLACTPLLVLDVWEHSSVSFLSCSHPCCFSFFLFLFVLCLRTQPMKEKHICADMFVWVVDVLSLSLSAFFVMHVSDAQPQS